MSSVIKTTDELESFLIKLCSSVPKEHLPPFVLIDDMIHRRDMVWQHASGTIRLIRQSDYTAEMRYQTRLEKIEKQLDQLLGARCI